MAARAHVVPMVFDTDGPPLWTGRQRRLPTTAQRHILVARDLGCTMPGCDLPAWRCQAHHSPAWAPRHRGDEEGRTDIDAMGLLCGYDHHRIDDWTMTIHRGRAWWIPPPWIDVDQTPRTNTFFKPLTPYDSPPPQPRDHA